MTAMVIDASISLAWCFEDEATPYTNGVLRTLKSTTGHTPVLWLLEVTNVLVLARRNRRITSEQMAEKLEFLRDLPIRFDPLSSEVVFGQVAALADAHGVTAYDAAYLSLALRLGLPLATLDGSGKRLGLKQAAERLGVKLFVLGPEV